MLLRCWTVRPVSTDLGILKQDLKQEVVAYETSFMAGFKTDRGKRGDDFRYFADYIHRG